MATLGDLAVTISANTTKFMSGISKVSAETKVFGSTVSRTVKDAGNRFSSLQKSIAPLVPLLSAVGTAFVVKDIITTGAQFQQTMAEVKGIANATQKEFEALTGIARKMGETTEFTGKQAAEGLKFLAMAGFEATDAVKALPGVLNLATAGNIDLGRAADIASNALTAMRMPVEELGRVNDVFVKTITSSNTNMEMMAESFKYAAPVAAAYGYTIDQVSGYIGMLGNAGIQGSMAGTALARSFQQTGKVFEYFGVQAGDASGYTNDLTGALKLLEDQGATAEEVMALFGERAGKAILALMGQGADAVDAFIKKVDESAGATEKMANTMRDTTAGAFKALQSAIESVKIDIFESQSNSLKSTIQDLTEWIRANKKEIVDFASSLGSAVSSIKYVAEAFGMIFSTVVEGWNSVPSSVQTAGIVAMLLFGKTGVITVATISAIAGALKELVFYIEGVGEATQKAAGTIPELSKSYKQVTDDLSQYLGTLVTDYKAGSQEMVDALTLVRGGYVDLTDVTKASGTELKKILEDNASALEGLKSKMAEPVDQKWLENLPGALNLVQQGYVDLNTVLAASGDDLEKWQKQTEEKITSAANTLVELQKQLLQAKDDYDLLKKQAEDPIEYKMLFPEKSFEDLKKSLEASKAKIEELEKKIKEMMDVPKKIVVGADISKALAEFEKLKKEYNEDKKILEKAIKLGLDTSAIEKDIVEIERKLKELGNVVIEPQIRADTTTLLIDLMKAEERLKQLEDEYSTALVLHTDTSEALENIGKVQLQIAKYKEQLNLVSGTKVTIDVTELEKQLAQESKNLATLKKAYATALQLKLDTSDVEKKIKESQDKIEEFKKAIDEIKEKNVEIDISVNTEDAKSDLDDLSDQVDDTAKDIKNTFDEMATTPLKVDTKKAKEDIRSVGHTYQTLASEIEATKPEVDLNIAPAMNTLKMFQDAFSGVLENLIKQYAERMSKLLAFDSSFAQQTQKTFQHNLQAAAQAYKQTLANLGISPEQDTLYQSFAETGKGMGVGSKSTSVAKEMTDAIHDLAMGISNLSQNISGGTPVGGALPPGANYGSARPYASGTGAIGLPKTGTYTGHVGEIVLGERASGEYRERVGARSLMEGIFGSGITPSKGGALSPAPVVEFAQSTDSIAAIGALISSKEPFSTGIEGLPATDTYYGEQGQIVFNPKESEVIREVIEEDLPARSYAVGTGVSGIPISSYYRGHAGEIVLSRAQSDVVRNMLQVRSSPNSPAVAPQTVAAFSNRGRRNATPYIVINISPQMMSADRVSAARIARELKRTIHETNIRWK